MNRKKEIILSLVGIFVLIFLMFGTTYAIFTYTKLGSTENIITTGALRFLYTENSGNGTGISITNAKPVADSVGMAYTSDGTVFDFKLEGTNTSDDLFYYKITLEKDSSSTLDESAVKVYLSDITDNSDTAVNGPISYSSLTEYNSSDSVREGVLTQGSVKGEYSKSFRLRVWVSDSIDFESGNYDTKTFLSMVNVYFDSTELNQVTKSLRSQIFSNPVITANPTLTTSSNNTSDASGLYKSTDTNDGSPTYYFRGAVENNYIDFAGFTWRIVRINEDGTIRIVMQDGINDNTSYKFNPTISGFKYMYYSNSNVENGAKYILDNWYQTNIVDREYGDYVVKGNYYCEQAKVKTSSSYTSGSATMTLYSSYTPNFKCETDGNGKGIVNSNIGLLTYDEVVHIGGYYNKNNSSYYLYNGNFSWTMSACGVTSGNNAIVCRINPGGNLYENTVHTTSTLHPVINLKADMVVTGSGTSGDPYKVV